LGKNKVLNLGLIIGLLTSLVFVSGCIPGGEGGEEASPWTMIGFLVLIFAMFYFLMIRPQRKRQKEQQEMMEELKKGDKVVTAGGIYGQIESVTEDNVVLKVESGATIRVAKSSVSTKRTK